MTHLEIQSPLPCPHCDYDLRATTSNRCPECGRPFIPGDLAQSAIPFSRTTGVAKIPAYIVTVWRISIGHKSLRHEVHKPQQLASARLFGRITALLLAGTFLLPFFLFRTDFRRLALQPPTPFTQDRILAGWVQDFAVPWWAGATLTGVIPLMLILLAFSITRAPRPLVDSKDPQQSDRCQALAFYAVAPLAWVLPITLLVLLLLFCNQDPYYVPRSVGLTMFQMIAPWVALVVGGGLSLLAAAGLLYRLPQSIARARNSGPSGAFFALLQLLALWTWQTIFYLAILPWAIGLLWSLIDSLR